MPNGKRLQRQIKRRLKKFMLGPPNTIKEHPLPPSKYGGTLTTSQKKGL